MKLLLISLIISTQTFAGTIVPNIRWNQITPNQSGAAAAFGPRNNVSATISTNKFEPENGPTEHDSSYGAFLNVSKNNYVLEGFFIESNDQSRFFNFANINGGFLLSEKLSIGAGLLHLNSNGFENNTLRLNAVTKLGSNLLVGGGINHQQINVGIEKQISLFVGAGLLIDKTTTAEAVLNFTPSKSERVSGGNATTDQIIDLDLQAIHTIDKIQVQGSLGFEKSENEEFNSEDTEIDLDLEGEFQLTSTLALGAGIGYTKRVSEDTEFNTEDETSTTDIRLTARFNISKLQVLGSISSESRVDDGDNFIEEEEEESKSFSVIGTYFF